MVGGTIVDIVKVASGKWWCNVVENFERPTPQQCAIFLNPQGEPIEVGDVLWWQGGWALWTPKVHPDGRSDVRLPRIGYSGVNHPESATRLPKEGG